ncbi:MAG: CPBP family intramembrane metalloprotease [Firmicutes bacterium]|nr:CPBP family intramembrane metalloprotease [Bacillota bacterium]
MKFKRDYYNPEDSGIGFVAGVVAPQIIIFALGIILVIVAAIAGVTYNEIITTAPALFISAALAELSFYFVYLIITKARRINGVKAAWLNKGVNFKTVAVLICLGAAMTVLFSPIIGILDYVISLTGYELAGLNLPLDNFGYYLLAVLLMAALPAFCEEFLFRGIILNGLRKYGMWASVLISALCFMLMHGNIQQTAYTFFLGIMLGYVVYKTRSLWAGIILHFVNNFIVITFMYLHEIGVLEAEVMTSVSWADAGYAVGAMIIGAGAVWLAVWLIKKWNTPSVTASVSGDGFKRSSPMDKTSAEGIASPEDVSGESRNDRVPLKDLFKSPFTVLMFAAGLAIGLALWLYNFIYKAFII